MANYVLNAGLNTIVIPRTETVANIVYSGALGTAYGTITVESNRTTPLIMNINNLKFGNVVGQPACIDFGNNNLQDNKLIYSGTNVILNDSNVSGETNKNCAIRVVKGTMLTIISSDSSAELQCKGDNSGAGIGGNYAENGGNITIDGEGTLNITAGYGASAIGGGGGIYIGDMVKGGNSGNILIKGSGTITATSDADGAAIGSGSFGVAENITIQGTVEVNAINNGFGAGIGGGQNGRSENIIITGSPKIVAKGGGGAAGIGGGYLGKSLNITISIVNPGTITSTGGDFGSFSGNGGAGIGGGDGNVTYGGDSGNISISGTGSIIATGGRGAAGIGSGNFGNSTSILINIEEPGSIKATTVNFNGAGAGIGAGSSNGAYGGNSGNIRITGTGSIEATGGQNPSPGQGNGGAGIGAGNLGITESIFINITSPGTIVATGGNQGAGIGGGCGNGTIGGDGGNITIYGTGDVKATGGEQGGGIGGGFNGDASSIGIVGAINIDSTGGNYGAGIGGGDYGCGGLIIVVGWGTVSAKNGGGIPPNAPQDIGKGGHCPNGPMDVVLSNPNFQNVNDPVLVKIKILLNGQPYTNKTVTLIIGENGALRLDTKTDSDGYVYFYATEGTYAFTATDGSYTLEEKYFTIPPMSNVPTQLVFSGGTNILRGINLFGVKK